MSPDDIKHFLLTYETSSGKVKVVVRDRLRRSSGRLRGSQQANGFDVGFDIVLLSADSLDTIKKTHSSYSATAPIGSRNSFRAKGNRP